MRLALFFSAVFWGDLLHRTESSSLERQNVICVLGPSNPAVTENSPSPMPTSMELRSQQHSPELHTVQDDKHAFPTTHSTAEATTKLTLLEESLALAKANHERKRRRKTKSKKDDLATENHGTSLDQQTFRESSLSEENHEFSKNIKLTPTFTGHIPHRASAHNEAANDNRLESTTMAITKGTQTDMTVMVTSSLVSINHNGQATESRFTAAAEPKKTFSGSRDRLMGDSGRLDIRKPADESARPDAFAWRKNPARKVGIPLNSDSEPASVLVAAESKKTSPMTFTQHMGDSSGINIRKPIGESTGADAVESRKNMARKAGIPIRSDSQSVSVTNDLSETEHNKWGDSQDRFNRQFGDTGSQGSSQTSKQDSSSTPKKTAQKPKKPEHVIPGAILVSTEHDPTQDFATRFNATWSDRTTKNNQGNVWEELDKLRGKVGLSAGEIQEILSRSVPGVDYPTYTWIPNTKFSCNGVNQPGFYADPETRCQGIRRCDYNGNKWNYLCPNATLFNQITLVCDWYFNIDCSKAVQYYDYSNSRLYHSDWVLLDSVPEPGMAG